MIHSIVETARNDLSVIKYKFIISFSGNKDPIGVSRKFSYRRCCVSVVMRPVGQGRTKGGVGGKKTLELDF